MQCSTWLLDELSSIFQVQCTKAGDLREKTQTPQENHNNAETKPGQDTEGQCSIAELIGRLTSRASVPDLSPGGLVVQMDGAGSLFGISSFIANLNDSPAVLLHRPMQRRRLWRRATTVMDCARFEWRLGQHAGMSWPVLAPFPSREQKTAPRASPRHLYRSLSGQCGQIDQMGP